MKVTVNNLAISRVFKNKNFYISREFSTVFYVLDGFLISLNAKDFQMKYALDVHNRNDFELFHGKYILEI